MGILSNTIKIHSLLKCSFKAYLISARSAVGVDLVHKQHGPNITDANTPIVVLHGLLGSKRNWDRLSQRMSDVTKRTVITADARNHGESPHESSHTYHDLAIDVSILMSKLTISKAHIIGHSMGGRTGMVLALTEPAKVASLIVVDISPVSEAGLLDNFFPRLFNTMKSVNFSGLDLSRAKALARQKIMESGLIEHDGLLHFIMMNVGKRRDNQIGWMCNVDALSSHFTNIARFPDMSGKKYDGPVLFIGGEQSIYIPPGDIGGIRNLFPKANLKYVKGVGHNVHAEDPNTFLNMVSEFLDKNK